MKLWEIEQGEQIRVIASTEKSKFEQTAFIELSKDGVIFVKPMYYEGQLLNFDGERLKISVVYIKNNEKPDSTLESNIFSVSTGKLFVIIKLFPSSEIIEDVIEVIHELLIKRHS